MSTAELISLVGALAALVTAITGLVSAMRSHAAINSQVKPQLKANAQAIVKVADETTPPATATEVRQIINGGASASTAG